MNQPDPPAGAVISDLEVIGKIRSGETGEFESLVIKYQPRVFAIARKYARLEHEVEDIVQEVFLKAFTRLHTFRAESPFEHWLMRLAVHTCYDSLRAHQRNREHPLADLTESEAGWLDRVGEVVPGDEESASAARSLVHRVLEQLTPEARLIITLLEIEERSVKEIAQLTGWSVPLVKVRAFRARAAMRKCLARMDASRYL